jgi:hypothetical protein
MERTVKHVTTDGMEVVKAEWNKTRSENKTG